MCGIVGQVRGDGRAVDRDVIERMCRGLEHRGPDARGTHVAGRAGLGIQRLRVIDLETGDQPIYNEDRTVAVVLNGEIYNYRELREDLQRRGHCFATNGDTEVIAHLYEEHGPACVSFLAGMFALAIWDARRERLVLARDRMGKKPLHYALRGRTISFASELGALLADEEIDRTLDPQALDCYFTYTYIPGPRSAFAAVRKLPPASTLVFEDDRVAIARYWAIDHTRTLDVRTPEEAGELVRDALRRAVRRRLIADVPLGAFLSGGVDSSAVVAAMAEASATPVNTFSIGFEHAAFDELPHARRIAQRFATEHREFVVRPDAVGLLPRLARHFGEPFADHSAIPSFALAELARRHVTVALNGDGGDESFGGYDRYVTTGALERLPAVPAPMRRAVGAVGSLLPGRAGRAGALLPLETAERYLLRMSRFSWPTRAAAYTPGFRALVDDDACAEVIVGAWARSGARTHVERMMDVDRQTLLADDLLVKMDIATMAHGLEGRSPLLDHELVELAAALPADLKVRGRQKKVALRAALRGWVDDDLLDRPKQGFELPVGAWFRGELLPLARDMLLDPRAALGEFVRPAHVRGLLDRHVGGREDHGARLWAFLVFECWHREVVEGAGLDAGAAVAEVA
jgi:asparagine synthase (glutamine-hydrolysing)